MQNYAKITDLARKHGVSRQSIYLWIRTGDIPPAYVRQDRGITLVHADRFADLIQAGRLMRPSGRRMTLGRDSLIEVLHLFRGQVVSAR